MQDRLKHFRTWQTKTWNMYKHKRIGGRTGTKILWSVSNDGMHRVIFDSEERYYGCDFNAALSCYLGEEDFIKYDVLDVPEKSKLKQKLCSVCKHNVSVDMKEDTDPNLEFCTECVDSGYAKHWKPTKNENLLR